MKKNIVLAIIIVLLALAVVFYSFDKKYPTYTNTENILTNKNVITHIVEIRASEFYPPKLIIALGEKVIWINKDNSPHTVTSSDKELNSAIIPQNETYYHLFEKEGNFAYNCSLRPLLSGEIDVGPKRNQ